MIRKFVLAGAAFAVAASLAGHAVAGATDYAFEPVKAEVKSGNEATVAVRLVHKPSGKPVADAAIVQTRSTWRPMGWPAWPRRWLPCPARARRLRFQGGPHDGGKLALDHFRQGAGRDRSGGRQGHLQGGPLAHVPEKWEPVFR